LQIYMQLFGCASILTVFSKKGLPCYVQRMIVCMSDPLKPLFWFMKKSLILFGLFVLSLPVFAQTQREIYNNSVRAYEAKDYKTFLKLTKTLDSLRPFHPTYTYNLASANALNDNYEEALIALRTLVLMDNTVDFENDEDFKSIKNDGGFAAILGLKKEQNKIIETSKPVVTLSEKELHPEGVTYLQKSKIWLASSIRKRKIISFDSNTGKCTDWLKGNSLLAVLAMKADAKEQFLWVATAVFPEMEHYDKTLEGKSEVLKVDIKTKQISKRFIIEGNHVFGYLVLAKNGTVYISDSAKPMVCQIKDDAITEFVSFENDGYNLQGLAFNATFDKLFVADYLKGITIVDIHSKTKTYLEFPEGSIAKGIDGLIFYGNSLIAVQNGVKPIRLVQYQLNDQQNGFVGFKTLDSNRPEFNEPALASLVGDKLYFFANSPWNAYNDKGELDGSKFTNPVLFSCKLN